MHALGQLMRPKCLFPILATFLLVATSGFSQDIVPRRWSHFPVGSTFLVTAASYTSGKIFLDPDLRIEDAEVDLQIYGLN